MRKSLLFAVLLLAVANGLWAAPVDPATALRVAENYLPSSLSANAPRRMIQRMVSEDQKYYICQGSDSSGYVIVAADDVAHPVLGYSLTGHIDMDKMPENMRAWLDEYSQQIAWAQAQSLSSDSTIAQEWEDLVSGRKAVTDSVIVAPLIKTTWSQSPYYNDKCPYDSEKKEKCLTGCVATAMAQIMKYWEHPKQGRGSYSYKHETYGKQSADFGNTVYQWSSMPIRLTKNSAQTCVDAVSTLMYHCGVAVDMDYSVDGSGAMSSKVANAVKEYFWYDERARLFYRKNYKDEQWIQMLQKQIREFGPMYYAGNDNIKAGHAFIFDGYTKSNKFHVNWGWGSSYDGYFAISALTPSDKNYNYNQDAVFYMIPKKDTLPHPQLEVDDKIYVYRYPVTVATFEYIDAAYRSDTIEVFTKITNIGRKDYSGSFECVLRDTLGNICATSNVVKKTVNSQAKSTGVTMRFDGLSSLKIGAYKISVRYLNEKGKYEDCDSAFMDNNRSFSIISKPNKHIILGRPSADSEWYYLTNVNVSTSSTPHLEGIATGTTDTAKVKTDNLDMKYYWSVEEQANGWYVKSQKQYLSWTSGASAIVNNVPLLLVKNNLEGGYQELCFKDGSQKRYLSVNSSTKHFSFYAGTQYHLLKIMFLSPYAAANPEVKQEVSSTVKYNLLGQMVDDSYQGVVITNGRKQLQVK